MSTVATHRAKLKAYLGKVVQVFANMQVAFVDLGLGVQPFVCWGHLQSPKTNEGNSFDDPEEQSPKQF